MENMKGLKINTSKMELLMFTRSQKIPDYKRPKLEGVVIEIPTIDFRLEELNRISFWSTLGQRQEKVIKVL